MSKKSSSTTRISPRKLNEILANQRVCILTINLLVKKGIITIEELNETLNQAGIITTKVRPDGDGENSGDSPNQEPNIPEAQDSGDCEQPGDLQ